jgi:hypothetical protein
MNPFPEEYELISFFEVEPNITDRDVPRFYNRLIFQNSFGDDKIRVEIEPGYGQIAFYWDKLNVPIISLYLEEVISLVIKNERNLETFIARFNDTSGILDFELQLKPYISVKWGNQQRH